MRLIDADAYQYPGDLANEPTIDAVLVVRCKDCKRWKQIREDRGRCKQPRFSVDDDELDPVTEPNAFCSYGDRKLLRLLPNCGAKMDGGDANE